ncbi:organic solvent tolerance protein OstA [Algoriphagus sp. NF]|jgi:lipopolysaccharide export system protein LptA|uniref:OstA-like protein n=1 Tax=Algoriphagus sp. NF TaxID=2992756 RepID=UPI001064B518|nr:OstA-like protein [Algoriphagus sp. NF]MDE0559840.1 organic solvent tolerance protein OstA [Algoriphagus sp. NF]
MNSRLKSFCLIAFLFLPILLVRAQENNALEILRADSLKGAMGFERLLGSVRMKNQSTLIECDSAHFFRADNKAKLYGRVFIRSEEDSVTTRSAYAEYDGNTKLAKLRTNVVFTNMETTVYTDYLDYDRAGNIAYYFNDGRVVDSTNVLTSEKGRYEVNRERITFTDDVVLVNPDYTMKTNFLVYLTIPKTAETKGLTNLISKDGNTLDASKGSFYDTQAKNFRFFDGLVETETSRVKADELLYRENEAYYEGKGDVRVLNKEREVEIFGDQGQYWEDRGYSLVHGKALVRRYFETDTLYMTADTLISQDHESDSLKYLLAFSSIQLVKSQMSGIADSLSYNYSDSTIRLFQDPAIWDNRSQITADSMTFFIENEQLRKLFVKNNAFAVMTDTLVNFNQMKGRSMTGLFENGDLNTLDITGNGESLYYALEGDTLVQGVNKTLSATIKMTFAEGKLKKVNYGVKPEGKFIPVQDIGEEGGKLEGFVWRKEEKPTMEKIFAWRSVNEVDLEAENLFEVPEAEIRMPSDEEMQKSLEKWDTNTNKGGLIPLKKVKDFSNE